ncbi:hypothetical protein [Nostocoides sp. HKS02]|uniref:hypothetical protein n=1 Tax=Nostocoides sp. HKS02 TaxID=1813880 RepID=UPI0012B4B291|nr:hypothetical protein [Tetrasphaera sp. HKS02]QGN57546.1 hypothetical protein GKE56_06300 [Tetrasphaera sp. HKS02]
MSDHRTISDPGPDPGFDPVDAFFTHERRATRALEAGDAQWDGILVRARRERMRRMRSTTAWAAAAAALVAAGVWGLSGRLGPVTPADTSPPVTSPSTQAPSPTPHPSRSSQPTPSTSSGSVGTPMPSTFRVQSLSTGDAHHLYALGTAACSGGASCPMLAVSADNGRSWRLVHTFPSNATANATAGTQAGTPVPGPAALSQVRFASSSIGWVFGGGAMRTSDGGATWQSYAHGSGTVLDLETNGKDVVLTTADRCSQGTCSGGIQVLRAPVTASAATDAVGTIVAGTVLGAPISWHGGDAYLSPVVTNETSGTVAEAMVLRADGLHPAGPARCANDSSAPQVVTPAAGTTLFALCVTGAAMSHLGYEVQATGDAAAAWRVVSTDALILVHAGSTSFAAADGSALLAVSGGSPDVHGSMAVSSDGGATWHTPRTAPPTPDHGWAWVGAPGGPTFYAISADPSPTFWKSTDRGETWAQVAVAAG